MLALVFFTFLLIGSNLASPLKEPKEDEDYRLPTTIRPINYNVHLKLEEDVFTTNDYNGTVAIKLNVALDDDSNKRIIKLHSLNLNYAVPDISLQKNGTNLTVKAITTNKTTNINTIEFNEDLTNGDDYVLTIAFSGKLDEFTMDGFYKSSYVDAEGETHFLATTQFESTSARKAFPSFDEPHFKATFDITLTFPKNYKAISNTPAEGQRIDDP